MKADNKYSSQLINLDIFSCAEETLHLYNQFMQQSYASSIQLKNLQADLAKFFDGLIWAEKKNPLLVYQMFQMNALNNIVEKYIESFPIVLLRNSILLLGNCERHGLVAEQLLQHAYPHFLIINIFKQQIFENHSDQIDEYIGNFLKCYHKLFKVQWLNKFILPGGYFELLEINFKFFNCLQFITRTSALNIVLDLLSFQQVKYFISQCEQRIRFYQTIFDRMTKLFRNELAEFGLRIAHISKNDNNDLILRQLEDKIALWEDISQNCKGIQKLIQLSFSQNVLFALILGPLQSQSTPLFSLKFSLFVLRKLIKTMKNLGILDVFVKLLFIQQSVIYEQNQLHKAMIPPFSLKRLTDTQIQIFQNDEKQMKKTNSCKFYQTLFLSKDNHFILITNSLISTLFLEVQSQPQFMKEYGLNYGGQLYNKIGKYLMSQLSNNHRLNTIQSTLNTLIMINIGKCLQTQLQNQYIYYFQNLIEQLKQYIKNSKQYLSYFIEAIEYDLNIVHLIQFAKPQTTEKYENLFKIVFVWDVLKQQCHDKQFYSKVPQTPAQYLRYQYIKFMLVRKARAKLLQGCTQDSLLLHFYETIITHSPFMEGDIYTVKQYKDLIEKCEILDDKTAHHIIYVKDEDFFVLGRLINQQTFEITHGVKGKHVGVQENKKKQMRITIREWNKQKQDICNKVAFKIKGSEQMYQSIRNMKKVTVNKYFLFIKESLEKTKTDIPSPSFI